MRAQRWIYWTAWSGLILMGVLVVVPVDAQQRGRTTVHSARQPPASAWGCRPGLASTDRRSVDRRTIPLLTSIGEPREQESPRDDSATAGSR